MKMKALAMTSLVLVLSSTLYAAGDDKRIGKYDALIKKLEKKTDKVLKKCKKKKECIEKEIAKYEDERNKIIKGKLKVNPKKFAKAGRKVINKEKKCLEKQSASAKKCFQKFEKEKKEVIATITK